MQVMDLDRPCRSKDIARNDDGEIGRRIDGLMHVKILCGPLSGASERRYTHVLTQAAAAMTGNVSTRQAALLELDLLGLELCDD